MTPPPHRNSAWLFRVHTYKIGSDWFAQKCPEDLTWDYRDTGWGHCLCASYKDTLFLCPSVMSSRWYALCHCGNIRLLASRPGRMGTLASSLELFLNRVKEFSCPIWPFSDEKPIPVWRGLLDVVVCDNGLQIKVISEEVTSLIQIPFNSKWPGPEQKKGWVRKKGSKDEHFSPIGRKYIFTDIMPVNASHPDKGLDSSCHKTVQWIKVPAFGAFLLTLGTFSLRCHAHRLRRWKFYEIGLCGAMLAVTKFSKN